MNKIFDSHAHFNDAQFIEDYDDLISRIKQSDVGYVLNCAWDYDSSVLAIKQSEKEDFMYASVGIHPHEATTATDEMIEKLRELAKHEKVVAIGEGGLDYYYEDRATDEEQKSAFIKQINLANETNLPLIMHSRDAMKDTIDILKENPVNSGVVHCFSGSAESCKILTDMGLYISFNGVITFPNARRAIESLKVVPLDKLLIETDCPYMAPIPHRGKKCDSTMLPFIIEKIASEIGISTQELIKITTENAKRLYKIKD